MQRGTLSDALALATRAHAGQLDKAGAPYIGHPQRVARSVAAAGGSETAQIAALLHDVVEDSDVSLDALADAGFGPEVVGAVDALTRRVGESYEDFVSRAGSHPITRLVKLADLADNLDGSRIATPTPRDLERAQRYRDAWSHLTGLPFPFGAPFPTPGGAEGGIELQNTRLNQDWTVVTAQVGLDGGLSVLYHLMGAGAERLTGDSDYEHYTTVLPSHLAAVRTALLEDLRSATPREHEVPLESTPVLDLLKALFGTGSTPSSDFEEWLRRKDIPYETFTY